LDLKILQLVIDFGFVVLIWAVQLVIYPSFKYYNTDNLIKWHRLYTLRVTYIVLPLMFTQLVITILNAWNHSNLISILSLFIVLMLWLLTFLVFVPIHQKIDTANTTSSDLDHLVSKNSYRTFLWSFLFLLSLTNFVYYT
jgi:hypothetical protein